MRQKSVQGQLDGKIPATSTGQSADSSALVDASQITLSAMGSMNMGGGKGGNIPGSRTNGREMQSDHTENEEITIPAAEVIPPPDMQEKTVEET